MLERDLVEVECQCAEYWGMLSICVAKEFEETHVGGEYGAVEFNNYDLRSEVFKDKGPG